MVVYLQNSLAAPRHQIRAAWHDHDRNFSLSAVQCLASLGDHLVEGVVVEQPGVVPRARALPAKQWQDMVWWKFLSLPVSSSRNSAHLHRVTGRTSHSTEVRVRDEGAGFKIEYNFDKLWVTLNKGVRLHYYYYDNQLHNNFGGK